MYGSNLQMPRMTPIARPGVAMQPARPVGMAAPPAAAVAPAAAPNAAMMRPAPNRQQVLAQALRGVIR